MDQKKLKSVVAGSRTPSSTFQDVLDAVDEWEKTTNDTLRGQILLLDEIIKAIDAWVDDKTAEGFRSTAGPKLKEEVQGRIDKRNGLNQAIEEINDLLESDIEDAREALKKLVMPFYHVVRIVNDRRSPTDAILSDKYKTYEYEVRAEIKKVSERQMRIKLDELVEKYIPTTKLLKDAGETSESDLVDKAFKEFMQRGRSVFIYVTQSTGKALFKDGTEGCCEDFSNLFSSLLNHLIPDTSKARTKALDYMNFYTHPVNRSKFIDPHFKGNLIYSDVEKPDDECSDDDALRFYFPNHWVVSWNNKLYCPTTGLEGDAVNAMVAEHGFSDTTREKDNQLIKIIPGKTRCGSVLYRLVEN